MSWLVASAAPTVGLRGWHNLKEQPLFIPSQLGQSSPAVLEDYPVARRDDTFPLVETDYLDRIARSQTFVANLASTKLSKNCQYWGVVGECPNGHRFAVRLNCGRQWCPICREEAEARRVARWLPKVRQMSSVGYFVIPPPKQLAPLLRSKRRLKNFRNRVWRAFAELGYARGLDSWHFFGDLSNDYFPHLNILVDGGWLEPEQLEDLKAKLREMIYSPRVRQRYHDKLDIHYEYRDTPAKIMHAVGYLCRATFLDKSWDEELAEELYGFHNYHTWGQWNQQPKWDEPDSDKHSPEIYCLAQGLCPTCKAKLTWARRPTTMPHLMAQGAVEIALGYYRLPDIRPPPRARNSP